MTQISLIVFNLEQARERSMMIWDGIPEEFYSWRPDKDAMTAIEMVRHVYECDYWYDQIIKYRNTPPNYNSPWENEPYTDIMNEIKMGFPIHQRLLETVRSFSDDDLEHVKIARAKDDHIRTLGNFLLRVAYHEAVHAGQMLSYMRAMGIERPNVWDL